MSLPKDNKDSIPEPVKGLEGIVAADTNLSSVNGEKGILRYCGYNIDDLAFNTTFEETICLLYDNELPNQERLEEMTKKVGEAVTTSIKLFFLLCDEITSRSLALNKGSILFFN